MWFWPGQTWDPNRQVFEVNRDLPDIFFITSAWGKCNLRRRDHGDLLLPGRQGSFHKLITMTDFNKKIYHKMSFSSRSM